MHQTFTIAEPEETGFTIAPGYLEAVQNAIKARHSETISLRAIESVILEFCNLPNNPSEILSMECK